jgi:hypothetical protein
MDRGHAINLMHALADNAGHFAIPSPHDALPATPVLALSHPSTRYKVFTREFLAPLLAAAVPPSTLVSDPLTGQMFDATPASLFPARDYILVCAIILRNFVLDNPIEFAGPYQTADVDNLLNYFNSTPPHTGINAGDITRGEALALTLMQGILAARATVGGPVVYPSLIGLPAEIVTALATRFEVHTVPVGPGAHIGDASAQLEAALAAQEAAAYARELGRGAPVAIPVAMNLIRKIVAGAPPVGGGAAAPGVIAAAASAQATLVAGFAAGAPGAQAIATALAKLAADGAAPAATPNEVALAAQSRQSLEAAVIAGGASAAGVTTALALETVAHAAAVAAAVAGGAAPLPASLSVAALNDALTAVSAPGVAAAIAGGGAGKAAAFAGGGPLALALAQRLAMNGNATGRAALRAALLAGGPSSQAVLSALPLVPAAGAAVIKERIASVLGAGGANLAAAEALARALLAASVSGGPEQAGAREILREALPVQAQRRAVIAAWLAAPPADGVFLEAELQAILADAAHPVLALDVTRALAIAGIQPTGAPARAVLVNAAEAGGTSLEAIIDALSAALTPPERALLTDALVEAVARGGVTGRAVVAALGQKTANPPAPHAEAALRAAIARGGRSLETVIEALHQVPEGPHDARAALRGELRHHAGTGAAGLLAVRAIILAAARGNAEAERVLWAIINHMLVGSPLEAAVMGELAAEIAAPDPNVAVWSVKTLLRSFVPHNLASKAAFVGVMEAGGPLAAPLLTGLAETLAVGGAVAEAAAIKLAQIVVVGRAAGATPGQVRAATIAAQAIREAIIAGGPSLQTIINAASSAVLLAPEAAVLKEALVAEMALGGAAATPVVMALATTRANQGAAAPAALEALSQAITHGGLALETVITELPGMPTAANDAQAEVSNKLQAEVIAGGPSGIEVAGELYRAEHRVGNPQATLTLDSAATAGGAPTVITGMATSIATGGILESRSMVVRLANDIATGEAAAPGTAARMKATNIYIPVLHAIITAGGPSRAAVMAAFAVAPLPAQGVLRRELLALGMPAPAAPAPIVPGFVAVGGPAPAGAPVTRTGNRRR